MNSHLSDLCKHVSVILKRWEEEKNHVNLKLGYLSAQKIFSKYVRKYRRQFNNKRQLDLLQQQKYNPKLFWKKFSQLGGCGLLLQV